MRALTDFIRSALGSGSIPKAVPANLPPEFDAEFYRGHYLRPRLMSANMLWRDYERRGRPQGHLPATAALREYFVKLLPKDGRPILEIGPFTNPASRSAGTKYFDVMDRAGLIARAESLGLPTKDIPEIHYVSPRGDLGAVEETVTCVISSHCIEHQPDLIAHLNQVENVLAADGSYFLIVPDKRYCFDHFLPESTVGEIIEAHRAKRSVHTLANVIAHTALTTHNDPLRHWKGDHGERPNDPARIAAAIKLYEQAKDSYLDVHALQFTPQSFRAIMELLFAMKLTKLRPVRVYDTPFPRLEFCAVLEKQS